MYYVISRQHCAFYWCNRYIRNLLPSSKRAGVPAFATPTGEEWEKAFAELASFDVPEPVNLLVDAAEKRRGNEHVKTAWFAAPIPDGAFRRINEHLAICGPELSFLQVADAQKSHGFEGLVRTVDYGFELCGIYKQRVSRTWAQVAELFDEDAGDAHVPLPDALKEQCRQEEGKILRAPVTNVEDIARFLDAAKGFSGVNMARKALRLIVENSASPMESQTIFPLIFPNRYGGYGFVPPKLNHSIAMNGENGQALRSPYVVVDACWPDADLIMEYYGGDEHTGDLVEMRDLRKKAVLTQMGNTVLEVACGLLNCEDIKVLASSIAQKLDDNRRSLKNVPERQAELLAIMKRIRTPLPGDARLKADDFHRHRIAG